MSELRRTARVSLPRRLLVSGAVVALVAAVSATAGMSSPQTARGAKSSNLIPLTISVANYSTRWADLFVARYEGFFKKAGLNLLIENNGTSYATVELSGRADLALSGAAGVPTLNARGQNLKIVYSSTYGDDKGYLVATSSSYHTTADLGKTGASVGIFATGGQQNGVAQALSDYVVAHGGKALSLRAITSTTGDFTPLVVAGTIDTAFIDPATAAPYIQAGKARWLTDAGPDSALMEKLVPPGIAGVDFWAPASVIQQKHDAIARFIAALREAEHWLASHKNATVATVLHNGIENFNFIDPALIQASLQYDRKIWATTAHGFVSNAMWQSSLQAWSTWGLPYKSTDPAASYATNIDMSPWNASTKLLNKLWPQKKAKKK